jgi:hypothetical protein
MSWDEFLAYCANNPIETNVALSPYDLGLILLALPVVFAQFGPLTVSEYEQFQDLLGLLYEKL